jgi:SNF2 family DNA or RNA helicase
MHRRIEVAHGTKEQRLAAINSGSDFVVINYDGLHTVLPALKGEFDLIVLDEATAIKTATTRRWKAANSLVQPDTWLWLMTGTPAAQSPLDAYGLAKLCTPSRVPSVFGAWRDKTMVKINMYKYVPSRNATDIVNTALQPAIRFTKAECLDLPEMLYETRDIPMSKQQEKYYAMLKNQLTVSAAGEQITAVHAAAAINKLLQISVGLVYSDTGEVVKFDADSRLQEVLSVVECSSNKTVVFVPFRHAIFSVRDYLEANNISTECIHGDVSVGKRTDIFKRFQETEDPRVLVIQPQAAAHGVTLTAADTIIWFGPTASVETYLQGNARIHRAGQANKTLVVKLCGSEVERKVYASLDSKEASQHKLLALYESILGD